MPSLCKRNLIGLGLGRSDLAHSLQETPPKSMAKCTPVGLKSQNALHAAFLAREGFTGHPQVLDVSNAFHDFNRTGR
ncbi:MAG: hypothetical protein ABI364_00050 [Caldimonas sp.]